MTEPEKKSTSTTSDNNFFQRKVGGVPMWVILVAVGLLILGLVYYKRKSSASNSLTTGTDTAGGTVNTDQSSLIPPFINQTYVQNLPPSTPDIDKSTSPHAPPPPHSKPPLDTDKTTKLRLTTPTTIAQLLKKYKLSPGEFFQVNPQLRKYAKHTSARLPKGTTVNVMMGTPGDKV